MPLDEETILASIGKTGRLIVADEAPMRCSIASEIIATVSERGLDLLKAPPVRVNRREAHIPSSLALEDHAMPSAERIAEAARKVCG